MIPGGRCGVALGLALLVAAAPAAASGWLLGAQDAVRVRSMGGCYAASSDWTDARLFNPAGLRVGSGQGLRLRFDPLVLGRPTIRAAKGDRAYADLLPWALPLRGVRLGWGPLHVDFTPADWLPQTSADLPAGARGAEVGSAEFAPSLTFAFAFDERVSLGATLVSLREEESARRRLGVSYGALLRVNHLLDVGAHAVYLPSGDADRRRQLDRIGDGTINVGLQVHPRGRATRRSRMLPSRLTLQELFDSADPRLALDMRNVTQEAGLSGRQEVHFGAAAGWFGLFELRAGFFWPRADAQILTRPRGSAGFGLTPLRPAKRDDGPAKLNIQAGWMDDPLGAGTGIWTGALTWTF